MYYVLPYSYVRSKKKKSEEIVEVKSSDFYFIYKFILYKKYSLDKLCSQRELQSSLCQTDLFWC